MWSLNCSHHQFKSFVFFIFPSRKSSPLYTLGPWSRQYHGGLHDIVCSGQNNPAKREIRPLPTQTQHPEEYPAEEENQSNISCEFAGAVVLSSLANGRPEFILERISFLERAAEYPVESSRQPHISESSESSRSPVPQSPDSRWSQLLEIRVYQAPMPNKVPADGRRKQGGRGDEGAKSGAWTLVLCLPF